MAIRLPVGGLGRPRTWPTLTRWLSARVRHREPAPGPPDVDGFGHRVGSVVAAVDPTARTALTVVRQRDRWVHTGIVARPGDRVVVLATGMVWGARRLGLGVGPQVALWIRVGTGRVASMTGASMVVEADRDGPVLLMATPPGSLDEHGHLDPDVGRSPMRGGFAVTTVRFGADVDAVLAAAARLDGDLFGHAAADTAAGDGGLETQGWQHHPRIGAARVFTPATGPATGADRADVDCHTRGDVSIICHPVDVPITADLHLTWSWSVSELPSTLPEDIELTHDYLSVAVAFDDGRDLSWMWSSQLPTGTVFPCPLPYWKHRETHYVIRSGTADLGLWIDERRNVFDDIRVALKPPYPRRVTGVWLIANSTFQRGSGTARFRDLHLLTDQHTHPIGEHP